MNIEMKNAILKLTTVLSFALLVLSPNVAFAADDLCPGGQYNSLCQLKADSAGNVVSTGVTFLFIAAVILTLFFLIWGGIRWTMSEGDKAKVQSARSTVIAAVVGLMITFLSYFILNVVLEIFTGTGLSSLSLPTLY